MSARKKGPAKVPKQKTVDSAKLAIHAMTSGNEKKYSTVIDKGDVMTWVGFGWVRGKKATKKDLAQYPVVTREGVA